MHNLDFKKYKRVFAFGCSFTCYQYPTWANLIQKACVNAEFYNFGRSGGGNLFISSRIVEADRKFKFESNDLIIVMWSTFCREDRFVNEKWLIPGNIFTQGEYDDKFVSKYADPKGYLIRDLPLIDLSTNYIKNLSSDSILLTSVPFDHQQDEKDTQIKNILNTYSSLIESFPKSIFEIEMNNQWSQEISFYFDFDIKNKTIEYHPHTLNYLNYLIKIGINLPKEVIQYAYYSLKQIKRVEYHRDLYKVFPELSTQWSRDWNLLW